MGDDTTVAELIDEKQQWREDLIIEHFRQEDAEAIIQIPLPKRPKEDQLIWHYDKKGHYSIKSGYQVAMRIKFPEDPSCSNHDQNQWRFIWKLAMPEKVKIFLWRAAHDLLPTAENLWKKKVLQEPMCQSCCCHVETVSHALVECNMARKIWSYSNLAEEFRGLHRCDIVWLLQFWPRQHAKVEGAEVAALLWAIWNARNKWLFEGKQENPSRVVANAEAIVESFKKVRQPAIVYKTKRNAEKQKQWSPPPIGWQKVNVDAAVDVENQMAGLGVVVRDSEGNCRAATIKSLRLPGSVAMAEATAMEWGLQVAEKANISFGIFESDSLEVIDLLNKKSSSLTEIGWLISDIQENLQNFQNFKAQHSPRDCNYAAHSLAKLALQKKETVIWLDEIPPEIMYLF
ncbi:hypothetical protein AB3S75_045503 [Citrus x aurantiifolia]